MTIPGPPTGDFDVSVPEVAGFASSLTPDDPVPWVQLDLPTGSEVRTFGVRTTGGQPIGSLVVVDGMSHSSYVDQLFEAPVQIVRDSEPTEDGRVLFVTNGVRAVWRGVNGHPVVAAEQTDAGLGQWVWEHDGLTWIGVGTIAMQPWVAGVIAAQLQALPDEPWDYSTLGGALYRNLAIVPGFTYMDDPVANVLDHIMSTFVGDCARHLYAGKIAPIDEPDPLTYEPADLRIVAADVAPTCLDGGFMDQLAAALQSMGLVDDVIGDVPVRRSATDVVVVDDDRVLHFSSQDPATLVAMAPFINAVVTGDLPLDVTNNTTLAVGTCLFRAPSESGRDEDRLTFAVDCAAPHQGEVFHRFDLEFPVYPGEDVAGAQAEQSCAAAFGDYIGIPVERSRLNFLYFYPSAGSWANSHVVQCVVYGSKPDEYFRTSLVGAAQ